MMLLTLLQMVMWITKIGVVSFEAGAPILCTYFKKSGLISVAEE